MFLCTEQYKHVRGFTYQPAWGMNGITIWLRFNEDEYRNGIRIGKERFPGWNTARLMLSFDAWQVDPEKYLDALRRAVSILTEEGIASVPVYLNGWFGNPAWGGFTPENISKGMWPAYLCYIQESLNAVKGANILMHDLSNEPFNNTYDNEIARRKVADFLAEIYKEVKRIDPLIPITIGTQGYLNKENPQMCDLNLLNSSMDVISLHPYNIDGLSREAHKKGLLEILEYVEQFKKPVIVTECCWGAVTAEDRIPYLTSELYTLKETGLGFICHGLLTSPVADLHPLGRKREFPEGLYMAFLDEEYNIRPGHEIWNQI